jgi:protein TonB
VDQQLIPMSSTLSPASSSTPRAAAPYRPAASSADWRYRAPGRGRRLVWTAAAVAAGVHVVGLFAFNFRARQPVAVAAPEVIEVRLALPEMPPEPEEQVLETAETAAESAGAMPVPMLAEVPAVVSLDSFVQAADFRPQLNVDFKSMQLVSIPTQIGTGTGGSGSGLSNVFSLSDLDKIPEPIVQTPPQFPYEQKRQGIDRAEVIVAFVVEADGRVSNLMVEQSSHREFESAALAGVAKWKFRPGIKGGRKVATRMRVPLRFALEDAEV